MLLRVTGLGVQKLKELESNATNHIPTLCHNGFARQSQCNWQQLAREDPQLAHDEPQLAKQMTS